MHFICIAVQNTLSIAHDCVLQYDVNDKCLSASYTTILNNE